MVKTQNRPKNAHREVGPQKHKGKNMSIEPPLSPLPRVGEQSEIEIRFKLSLLDGTLVEQTEGDQTFRFTIGDGQFIHNLEEMLIGLEQGTTGKFRLSPEQAFGMPDSQNYQTMTRSDFPEEMEIEEGYVLGFTTPGGDEIPGTIHEIRGEEVVVDFNHPLAGHTVVFEATVEKIIEAELSHH